MIRVMIADDMPELTRRFANILSRDEEIEVLCCVHSGEAAIEECMKRSPDVVLMDVEMETRTAGLWASREILEKKPGTKIVILTVYEDDETVFTAFELGVSDYVLKNSMPVNMITCVKDAYRGQSPIRPVVAKKIRREFQRIKKSEGSFLYCLHIVTQLTQTELDVLDLISRGYTRQQICELRCVELSTVKRQIHNILAKFHCSSMSEVVSKIEKEHVLDYIRDVSGKRGRNAEEQKGEAHEAKK